MVKVAAIQLCPKHALVDENRQKAVCLVKEAATQGAKLICLPELWVTGYQLESDLFQQLAETVEGITVSTFQALAKELNVVLIVPFPEREIATQGSFKDQLFISAAIINADGQISGIYRKSMLWGGESGTFVPGEKSYPVYETAIGKIGVLICYDIEFPEPARLLALEGADLIVVPSVWSIQAESRWDIQLPARALDNSVYILGVNAVGEGACGKSKFVSPEGMILNEASTTNEIILYGNMDIKQLIQVRSRIPYLKDYPRDFTPGGSNKFNNYIR